MTEVINLRLQRKRKQRADKERTAAENRVLHGRSKAETQRQRIEKARSAAFIDGHRREPDDRES
jgi:hypothetical protein